MSDFWKEYLDERPIIVAIAGSNGAGKSTFYGAHLAETDLRFVNADELALELKLSAYEAADLASKIRQHFVARRESFIFETVFSDPVGEKVQFLKNAADDGYQVALIFIEIPDVETSTERVSMRQAQGGHDDPDSKLKDRFPRTRANLQRAIEALPLVVIFDNSDMERPFRLKAVYREGKPQ